MNFGQTIEALKQGKKVQRAGWNGKGMWIVLVPGSPHVFPTTGSPYFDAGLVESIDINPHIDMFTSAGKMQPGWLASQEDMLSEDWQELA